MKTYPIAKINLGLNVVERRADGYHNLETIFYPVNISEKLSVEALDETDKAFQLTIVYPDGSSDDGSSLCPPEKNLVVKAYMLIKENYPQLPPVHITLHKLLPSQAGMGAGSSDAAFMIRLLNEQFSLGMTIQQMQQYAAKIGADCAFFITSETSYATGIGDILSPLPDGIPQLKGKYLALVKPDCAVSTKEAYAGIHPHSPKKNCLEVIKQPIETWREDLVNDFEESIFPVLPELAEVKQALYDNGAIYAAMSGSGSTIFGIFNNNPSFISEQYGNYFNTIIPL